MTEFPVIHTNVWDAIAAVPAVLILTQILKLSFHIPGKYVPALAGFLGMGISIFISHPHHLSSGIFMGFFLRQCSSWSLFFAQDFDFGIPRAFKV